MVNNAYYLIALFDGNDSGGTAYTVRYAKEKDRKIITIHPDTLAVEYPAGFAAPDDESRRKVIQMLVYKPKP